MLKLSSHLVADMTDLIYFDLIGCLVAPQKQYKDIDWSKFAEEEDEEEEEEEDDE